MTTARTATLLTVFFAFLCVLQVSLIAQTLDRTRSELSSRSTGAINSLTQIDRNLDQLNDTLLVTLISPDNTDNNQTYAYQDMFEIFWASVTVLNLRTPGTLEPMPAAQSLLAETQLYLDSYDPLVFGDAPLNASQRTQMYRDTLALSDKFHDLSHDYFLALSVFSDELKDRTKRLYQTFLGFALMVLACGTVSLLSLFKANRKSEQLVEQSNITQARLTQVVDELRSGKLENKAKDSFLAAASHDLRQPLHALGMFLGALEKHVQPSGHAIMAKAQESSSALTRLLSSLLDLSRLDAGAIKVQHRTFNIGKLINTLDSEFQPTATLRNITLKLDSTEHMVYSDRILIDRVLRNLIENALTHSHGTLLEVHTSVHVGKVRVTVTDNGIGIPNDMQDDIFSEYFQIGNPERDRSKGLGIGLAIVKRLSEMLELDLQLRSSDAKGCTFSFSLPLSEESLQTPDASSWPTVHTRNDRNILVAVIEDEQGVRDGMEVMLHSRGYSSVTADSADTLITLLQQHSQVPDVLISDYRLRRGHRGDSAIKTVVNALGREVPSVIITGDTSPQRVKELAGSGYKLMHKPVEPQELLSVIEQLAALSMARNEATVDDALQNQQAQ
ncbi:MAG: ATP-binding protein [Pseudomonadota bacterium]